MSLSETDPRHLARILASQYLFTKLKKDEDNYTFFEANSLLEILEEKKFDTKLYEKIIDGVESTLNQIDKIIEEIAPEWPTEQINPVNLTILRSAIWEGFIGKITPSKVVINEAIEISKIFGTENDSSFVNGVLGKLYESLELNQK